MDFHETRLGAVKEDRTLVDLTPLHEGAPFLKLTASGDPLERTYYLSEDNRYLKWNSNFWAFKSPEKKRIDVHSIKRIQKGQLSVKFERWKSILHCAASRSFSIVYGEDSHTLDLIADTEDQMAYWHCGLRQVMREVAAARENMNPEELYLKSNFETASSAGHSPSRSMDLNDLHSALHRMSHPIHDRELDAVVLRVCGDLDRDISRQEFDKIVVSLWRRFDMEHLWKMLVEKTFDEECGYDCRKFGIAKSAKAESSSPADTNAINGFISENDFHEFWGVFQDPQYSEEILTDMILEHIPEQDAESSEPISISYDNFLRIMSSAANDAYNPKAKRKFPDKFRSSLSDYYIAASHNTYLAGDQITGAASADRYVDVLEKGCRCVEIQCWDGASEEIDASVPVVGHGSSLANNIPFDEVIRIIRDTAFSMNSKGEVNDMPVIISLRNHCSWDQQQMMADILKEELGDMIETRRAGGGENLPSPLDLREKILIKSRKVDGQTNSALHKLFYFTTSHSADLLDGHEVPITVVNSCDDSEAEKRVHDPTLLASWTTYNKTHISRVYAGGKRIRSSNMNPISAWSAGVQIVAMNYQSDGIPMFLNHGKFLENQNSGYVLKPEYMIKETGVSMPACSISVHVIGGNQLPRPGTDVINPCVIVNICGIPADSVEHKTKTVENNGFNPIWDELFTFVVTNPECAHLLFRVVSPGISHHDFIAFSSIPIRHLLHGFRNVCLYDKNGTRDGPVAHASLSIRTTRKIL